jgi:hypothetical protein
MFVRTPGDEEYTKKRPVMDKLFTKQRAVIGQ